METLRLGSMGDNVVKWKYFLLGQKIYIGMVTPEFDQQTVDASKIFQYSYGLNSDGIIGNATFAQAMKCGFQVIEDNSSDKSGYNWPPRPDFQPLIGNAAREQIFGKFAYVSTPSPSNPEAIHVTDDWCTHNLTSVHIPQLVGIPGSPKSGDIEFHKLAIHQLSRLFNDWEKAGLLHLVKTWNGSYSPRFIRGSTTSLSNHAWGTAFDINVQWNALGTAGPLVGQEGSTRELIPLANANGFYAGLHFKSRPDPMHFEIAKIQP